MNFEYFYQERATADIDIDDIGNVALIGNTDFGTEFYLIVHTDLGLTATLQYGPSIPDSDELPLAVGYNYQRFEFNESKIIKLITKFINAPGVTQVREVEPDEIKNNIKELKDYI